MLRKLFLTLLLLSCLGHLTCGGSSTGPSSSAQFVEFNINNPVSLLDFLAVDLTNLQSFFLVDWTSLVDFDDGTTSPYMRVFARAFTPNQQADDFQFRGVEMGEVILFEIESDTVKSTTTLSGSFSPAAGFVYRGTFAQAPGNPRFIPSGILRFQRAGTASLDSLTIVLTAPSDSIFFTSPDFTTTIDADQELRITWQGGTASDRILLTIQPVFFFSNGMGFSSGTFEFLDANPMEFNLSQERLQGLLENANQELVEREDPSATVEGLFVYVAIPSITEAEIDGDRCVALAFASDQLFLRVNSSP